jgi:hypothetical protein
MMKKQRFIPFKLTPASWGLMGKTRAVAEAEYYYTGEELERALVPINFPNSEDVTEATKALMKIDLKYGKLSEYEYQDQLITLDATSQEDADLRRLKLKLDHGKISVTEYDRSVADIKKEPWVNIIKMELDEKNATAGYVELDWNDHFIRMLSDNGYVGRSDDDIVNKWFNDVCKTVLIQEKADLDYGLQPQEGRTDVIRRANQRPAGQDQTDQSE